eukprot:3664623-Pyramimonas_sp.AAC.1
MMLPYLWRCTWDTDCFGDCWIFQKLDALAGARTYVTKTEFFAGTKTSEQELVDALAESIPAIATRLTRNFK